MTDPQADKLCLTLLCPLADEEELLDLLLLTPELAAFTSMPVAAHGIGGEDFSQAEQVLGRALMTQVTVLLDAAAKPALLEAIRRRFVGAGLRYWLTPVLEQGEIA
jgi:hypothetical protein